MRLLPRSPFALAFPILILGACSSESVRLEDLHGSVVSTEPLIVTPGPRWEHGEDGWEFRNRADLVVCRQGGEGPFELLLEPDAVTSRHGLEVRRSTRPLWTGVPADGGSSGEGSEAARDATEEPPSVEIEIEASRPGRVCERWELVRRYDLDQRRRNRRVENVFTSIRIRSGEAEAAMSPVADDGTGPVLRLVRDGVLGRDSEGRSGTLFLGPRQARADVGTGRFVVEPENRSERGATFRLVGEETVELRLEPGERGRLEVPVDGPFDLRVDGSEDGLFFWASPRLLDASGRRSERLRAVVLVTLDTTRRDALSPWSGDPAVTPFLDELAAESIVFDDAWTTAPWTLPSHASMMTGLWPSRHGAGVDQTMLPRSIPTLAELFRDAGWRTLGFVGGELCSSRFGMARGFDRWRDPEQFETVGDRLLDSIRLALDDAAGDGAPVFLFANFFDPHALWQAPAEYRERLGVEPLAEALAAQEGWSELVDGKVDAWRRAIEGEIEITPEARAWMEAAYLAEVAFVDDLLRGLVEKLRELGWWDRTLLLITSDHGELLGESGYVSHGARLDPELVSAPLLLRVPGEEGRRDSRLASSVDVFPTLLGAAGLSAPPSDGRSLLAAEPAHPWVLSEEHESLVHPIPDYQTIAPHLYALQRLGHRHLVWEGGDQCGESGEEGWAEVACEVPGAEVLAALEEALGGLDHEDAPPGEPGGALAESLEALGYM